MRAAFFTVLFCVKAFSLTLGDVESKPVLEALDSVKAMTSDYRTVLKLRDLKKETQENFQEGITVYVKFHNEYTKIFDSTGSNLKPGADTVAVKAYIQKLKEWRETKIPLSTSIPIKLFFSENEMVRIAKRDFDLALLGLVEFKIKD